MKNKFLSPTSPLTSASDLDFFVEGKRYYQTYLDLIDSAQYNVHLQTYIFEMDAFGSLVHAALLRAVQRGVQVFLLVDSVGSKELDREHTDALSEAGVYVVRFNSLHVRWFYQWGRRLHHKILLIDQEQAVVGGINVTTSGYGNEGPVQQLDFAVLLKGAVIDKISNYCEFVFQKTSQRRFFFKYPKNSKSKNLNSKRNYDLNVSINDWVYRRWQITHQYSSLTKSAQKEITIINSYFFPQRRFRRKLVAAAKRGVRVRLILPKLSDWPSYILASQYLYGYFLKRGVEIYEWKKSVLHGKLATVDGSFTTVGSYNLNYTSFQQNLEMNIDVYSKQFTGNLNEVIEELIALGCEKVDPRQFIENADLKTRFLRIFYYFLLSWIANFSVILTYQEGGRKNWRSKYFNLFCIVTAVICFLLGIVGAILPVIPGFPFFVVSVILIFRQLIFHKNDL